MSRTPGQRLTACHVVSLRPSGDHAALRRAAAREGAHLIALSPWRIEARHDEATRDALRTALRAPRVVFTSPAAVRAAHALIPLRDAPPASALAVGTGTARALRNAGVSEVMAPRRMDSHGLLELEALQAVSGTDIGLVTAPGGRGLIAAELQRRGARVLRADVYARVPIAPSRVAIARLVDANGCLWLALSSGEALQRIEAALPQQAWKRLLRARVAAASERLAEQARGSGFADVVIARGPQPRDLVEAMAEAMTEATQPTS